MTRHDVWATYLDEPTDRDVADDERAALDRIRAVLADPDTWSEPPAGLTARVLERAAADLDSTPDAPEGDATVTAPEGDATAAAPKDDATVTGSDDDITVASSDDNTTVTASGDDAAVTADTDEATAAEAGPESEETKGARLSSVPAVGAETGGRPTGDPVEGSSARQRAERRWSGQRVGWIAGAAATAAAAVLAVVLLWPGSNLRSYPVSGTAAQPGASAVVTLDPKPAGVDISIEITGLPPSTEDTYYAAWLRGPEGVVPVGSFHWKKAANPISLWSGVEADRYPTFFITRQREGDPPTPSADVVLQGQLA
jgi:hypothetical protein